MGKHDRQPIDTAYCRILVGDLKELSDRMLAEDEDRRSILDGALVCAGFVALHDAAAEIDRLRARLAEVGREAR